VKRAATGSKAKAAGALDQATSASLYDNIDNSPKPNIAVYKEIRDGDRLGRKAVAG